MGFEKDQASGETGGGAACGADALAWGVKGMATADAPGGVTAEAGADAESDAAAEVAPVAPPGRCAPRYCPAVTPIDT